MAKRAPRPPRQKRDNPAPDQPPATPSAEQLQASVQRAQTALAQATFLETYAAMGNVSAAAKLAGVGRRTHYDWLAADAAYATRFAEAVDEAADRLEAEARRRAVEGLVRYKFDKQGDPLKHPASGEAYFEREYSDTLLIFLLKGARPDKYAERHQHAGTGKKGAFLLEEIVAGAGALNDEGTS